MQKQPVATIVSDSKRGDEPEITISTIGLDRDCDEVVPEGCDFTDYQRNPVVQFGHDYSSLPVGATTALDVVPGRGVRARWRWLEGDPFADRVRNAFEQGVLRAASIGFQPTASEPNGRGGTRFTRWTLLEWSLVPVPANAEAVRSLKRLRLWADDEHVLTLDDEDLLDVSDWDSAAERRLREGARRRRSEPFEPVIDVNRRELASVLRGVVSDAVARQRADLERAVRAETAAAINRARGRLD